MEIGQQIKERREAFRNPDFTQKELAAAARTHYQTISKIERGIQEPRRSLRLRIFKALEEEERRRVSLRLVTPSQGAPKIDPLTSPDLPVSTNRENIPKGGADDTAETRLRELEARIQQIEERHAAEIQDLRNLFKEQSRVAIKRAESRPTRKNQTRRGKTNR